MRTSSSGSPRASTVPMVRLTKDFQEACNHPKVKETQDFPPADLDWPPTVRFP